FNESLRYGRNISYTTVDPHSKVYTVCQKIAGHPRTCCIHVQTPSSVTALGHIWADGPVLKKIGAEMEYLTKLAGIDNLFGQGHCRHTSIIIPHGVFYTCFFDSFHHFLALFYGPCQWLLAKDHFSRLSCSDSNFGVAVIWGTDINSIDIIPSDDCSPVRFIMLIAPLFSKSFYFVLSSGTSDLKHWTVFVFWEKIPKSFITIGMDTAHQAGPNQCYSYFFFVFHW